MFSITWTSTQEQVALSLPVSCRCPADCGKRWPCGAPPPARRCAACTRCCAPPGGAPVCAGLPDPPASSCTSPPVLQAGSPGQTSAWGGGEDSVGGVEYQHRNMTFTQYIRVDVYLTTENQQLWRSVNAWNSYYQHRCQREELNGRLCVGSVGVVSVSGNW